MPSAMNLRRLTRSAPRGAQQAQPPNPLPGSVMAFPRTTRLVARS
jgi:hypothetical protein